MEKIAKINNSRSTIIWQVRVLTKFHYNWAKIVDFLSLANFCARVIFFVRVSSLDLFSKMMMCMGTFIGYSKVFSILLVML